MFIRPVVELYGGGHSHYGFYDPEQSRSAERVREMVPRAGNFLAEALAAYSSTAGSGAVHDGTERRVITRLSYDPGNEAEPV